jgi:hypothetical protein
MSLPPVPARAPSHARVDEVGDTPLDRMLPFAFLAFDSNRQTEIR